MLTKNDFSRAKECNIFAGNFAAINSHLSRGATRRRILASYLQWRAALGMAELSAEQNALLGIPLPAVKGVHSMQTIRIGTPMELADALAYATQTLKHTRKLTDVTTYEFAHSFFAAISLTLLHGYRTYTLSDVFLYAVDKRWDYVTQQIQCIRNTLSTPGSQPKTKAFSEVFCEQANSMTENALISLVERSHELWTLATSGNTASSNNASAIVKVEPANKVQIFSMAAIAGARTCVSEMIKERMGSADRMLRSAAENNGYRTLPDPVKARAVLEEAKGQFENLIAPIEYLQKNLALSAAMSAENFRVRPILLLGDPGIGKTFLAMELAKSLSGKMEKVSAAGVGFLLNGSQSTWTGAKCGQVFKALAEGSTTSPVFIVDEVDKMENGRSSNFSGSMLPVLLELLEPGTSVCFKDEFFEIDFDASRIIFILTANDLSSVPEPLRSRVEIFDVPHPQAGQRMRIIKDEFKELNSQTNSKIKLDVVSSKELASRTDIDMRRTGSFVREAFIAALMGGKKTAKIIIPDDDRTKAYDGSSKYHGTKTGFMQETSGQRKTAEPSVSMVKGDSGSSRKDFALDLSRERSR